MNASPSPTPAPLCPLPRDGIKGSRSGSFILHIGLLLATVLIGLGIGAMRTVSEAEVRAAEILSAISIVLLVVYLWRAARTARGTIVLMVILGAFLTYLTHSLLPAGVLCGLLFAVSAGSLLVALQPRQGLVLLPLIPLLAYAVTAAVTRDLVGSIAVLVPYPPMIALALGTRSSAGREDGLTRVGVICATSLALGLSMGGMILLSALRAAETTDLPALLDNARASVIQALASQAPPAGLPPESIATWNKLFSYANVENLVNSTFNILPALFTVAVLLLATVCQTLQHAALRSFGLEDCLTDRTREFRMSLVSCLVFLAAYLTVFLDTSVVISLPAIVAQNIYIILIPGLALAGAIRIQTALVRKGPRGGGCLFYLILLIPCLFVSAPVILAAVEVIGHLFTAITAKLKEAFKSDDDDDPFGDSD